MEAAPGSVQSMVDGVTESTSEHLQTQIFSVPPKAGIHINPPPTWQYPVYLHASAHEPFRKFEAVIEQQKQLEQRHAYLENAVDCATLKMRDLRACLQKDAQSMSEIGAFLESCLSSIPPLMRSTGHSASKAEKVFGTVELVESIFGFLNPWDVLIAVRKNKTTSNAIASSPKLQEKLHLRPSKDGFINSLFDFSFGHTSDFTVSMRKRLTVVDKTSNPSTFSWNAIDAYPDTDERGRDERVATVTAMFSWAADEDGPRTFNGRMRDIANRMLICQPPIKELHFWPQCCYKPGWMYPFRDESANIASSGTVTSKEGFTVGELHEAFIKIKTEHQACAPAEDDSWNWNSDHTQCTRVYFEADVQLKRNDQWLAQWRRDWAKNGFWG